MKIRIYQPLIFFMILSMFLIIISCEKKEEFINKSDAIAAFSSDSVVFDTVFTTIGSVTKQLRVYNNYDKKLKIGRIYLKSGSSSSYRMNIDGTPTLGLNDLEIDANDSIFIFVKVTIDPNDDLSPFVVSDQIVFETNGNTQEIELAAWGQNANYIVADQNIPGFPPFKIVAGEYTDTTWNSEKPYLVYGYAVVDSNAILRISEGTQIHLHSNSGLWVYKGGSLKVNGTMENPVVFQGDRLEYGYSETPGQWDRIWLNEGSINNEFNYAIIKNGFIGIQAETLQEQMGNALVINNTIIENMTGFGLFSRYYNISAANLVIGNCEIYDIALTLGGNYDFRQCTFANYWNNSLRQTPNLILNNYYKDINDQVVPFQMEVFFRNCINYGRNDEEMEFDLDTAAVFNYTFENCLLKTSLNTDDPETYINCIINDDPLFVDPSINDYHLDSLSPAIDRGNTEVAQSVPEDIDGVNRLPDPDIGAYEYVPGRWR